MKIVDDDGDYMLFGPDTTSEDAVHVLGWIAQKHEVMRPIIKAKLWELVRECVKMVVTK